MITTTVPTFTLPPLAPDGGELLRALRLFVAPGDVAELRALDVSAPDYRRPHTVSGYYDNLELMARDAANLAPQSKGVYFTLNPVNRALLARACNRCRPIERESLTSDGDVVHRRWLPVDFDAKRPADVSATDAEHEAAIERARVVYRFLRAEGWPEPITADSGNGAHLVYPIDMPVEDKSLVKRVLEVLAFRFDDDLVTVDQKNFNPARIWKLYGTVARKGDNVAERPHRLARLLHVPEGPT